LFETALRYVRDASGKIVEGYLVESRKGRRPMYLYILAGHQISSWLDSLKCCDALKSDK
jgi:hypothetical protein